MNNIELFIPQIYHTTAALSEKYIHSSNNYINNGDKDDSK